MLIVALALFAPAVVAVGVGVAGLAGVLPGNRFVGVTTEPAIRTEQAFRVANRVAAPTTIVAGLILAVGGLAALGMGAFVGSAVAVVALATALFTAGSGVALGTRAAEALAPATPGGCGQACGGCSLKDMCASAESA